MRLNIRKLTLLTFSAAATCVLVASSGNGGSKASDTRTPVGMPTLTQEQKLQTYRALLDSLGAYKRATLLRVYVTRDGSLGRAYGTLEDLPNAATNVSLLYRDKLKTLGWETLEEHASISGYAGGNLTLLVLRSGPQPAESGPGESTPMFASRPSERKSVEKLRLQCYYQLTQS